MGHHLRRASVVVASGALIASAGVATVPQSALAQSRVVSSAASTPSPAAKAKAAKADARIKVKLRARVANPALGRDVAVRVYDPVTGKLVFSAKGADPQLPASNMKLVTATNALDVIGPATRFPTVVVRGTGSGSIVLVGGGDPLLDSGGLRTLATRTIAAFKASSPTHTAPTGLRLAVDDSLFPKPSRATGWTSSYGLGDISPVRALARHGVASSDTTSNATAYFIAQLKAAGVNVNYVGRAKKPTGATEVARLSGHTVSDAVSAMLLTSDNQIAETLYRQVAVASGRPATWAGAAAAARAALATSGVPLSGARLYDGSGLSRSDRLSANTLLRVVRLSTDGKHPRLASLIGDLPVAGRTGTLKHRFAVKPARCAVSKVRAKTGFVNGVVALSGVATGSDGKRRVFSIVANGIPMSSRYPVAATQRAVDQLAATITGCY